MNTMYASSENNIMQGTVKKSKMLAFFNALEESDKDIVIAMAESLVERCKGNQQPRPEVGPSVRRGMLFR